jgi:hypothetical protein
LGFPRALYRNSAQIRNSPVTRRPLKDPWGGTTKKDTPGTSGRLFWGAEGVGAEVKTLKRGRQQLTLSRT